MGSTCKNKDNQKDLFIITNQLQIITQWTIYMKEQQTNQFFLLPPDAVISEFKEIPKEFGTSVILPYTTKIFTNETLLLFQVLDFNHKLLTKRDYSLLNSQGLYRIAWAYLKPIGLSKRHLGISKLQLYYYQFQQKNLPAQYQKKFIPNVYFDFLWPEKDKYNGFITIQLIPRQRPPIKIKYFEDPEHIFQLEKGDKEFINRLKNRQIIKQQIIEKKEFSKIYRFPNQSCKVPNQLYDKLITGYLGCFRLKFSNNGKYLVAACTDAKSNTILKFYQILSLKHIYSFRGHTNLIHDIDWDKNDNYILSCSSDFTAKVWIFPHYTQQFIDQEESEQKYLVTTLVHASYVYSAKFYIMQIRQKLLIATATFDGYVRLWNVECNNRSVIQKVAREQIKIYNQGQNYGMLSHRYPNSLCFSENDLIIGDSFGHLHFINININQQGLIKQLKNSLTNPELKGDTINSIKIQSNNKLLIHSRDNVIRLCQIGNKQIQVYNRYFGSQTERNSIRSTISPDQRYVLSASQDGKPHLWDQKTAFQEQNNFQLDIKGILTDVDWNNKYHMVAFAGFLHEFPIYVYVYKKSEEELAQSILQNQQVQQSDNISDR